MWPGKMSMIIRDHRLLAFLLGEIPLLRYLDIDIQRHSNPTQWRLYPLHRREASKKATVDIISFDPDL